MKKKKLNILVLIFVAVGLFLMLFGVIINIIKKKKKNSDIDDNNNRDEELAIVILEDLEIDNYLKYVFNLNVELDKNLLDVGTLANMQMFFQANDNLEKYKIKAYDTDVMYGFVKYSDYLAEHQRVFGIDPDMTPDYDMAASVVFSIPNFLENTNQEITTNDVRVCDKDSYDNCFVMLVPDYDNNTGIKFSALSIDDKKISGNIRATVTTENLESYLDGSFEFEFEKQGNDYIAKSLKIVSVADSYNSADRK